MADRPPTPPTPPPAKEIPAARPPPAREVAAPAEKSKDVLKKSEEENILEKIAKAQREKEQVMQDPAIEHVQS